MRRALALFCLGGFTALASMPVHAQQASPFAPVPAGSFQFQGAWQCAGAFANGKTHRSTFTASVILAGKWLELGERDVEPATGYVAQYVIGYDPQQKRMVEFDANNFGAATYSSADGWVDGVLTMTSAQSVDPKAPYSANRFVYSIAAPDPIPASGAGAASGVPPVRPDPGTFTVDWQIQKTPASNWMNADHLVCRTAQPA